MSIINEKPNSRRRNIIPSQRAIYTLITLAFLTLGVALYPRYHASSGPGPGYGSSGPYGPVVGIDIGQSYSRAATVRNGIVEMISTEEGEPDIPSWGSNWLVSDTLQRRYGPSKIDQYFCFRKWLSERVQKVFNPNLDRLPELSNHWPPEAYTLNRIRSLASVHMGEPVTHAVLTISADANDSERQALRDAASLAGLKVLRIINAPTAAAIAHGLDKDPEVFKRDVFLVVVDVGASALRTSVLSIDDGVFEILETSSNHTLGGDAYSKRILKWLSEEARGTDQTISPAGLNQQVERIKQVFSSGSTTETEESNNHPSQAEYEGISHGLVDDSRAFIEKVLSSTSINKTSVDRVIVVGGSDKLPQIQFMIEGYFDKKTMVLSDGKPEETAARGAAIQGAILGGIEPFLGGDTRCTMGISTRSIGIETSVTGGVFYEIIPWYNVLPTRRSRPFKIPGHLGEPTRIRVFEGLRKLTQDNRLLKEFEVHGMEIGSKITISVEWDVDDNRDVIVSNSSSVITTVRLPDLDIPSRLTLLETEQAVKDLNNPEGVRVRESREALSRAVNLRNYVQNAQMELSEQWTTRSNRRHKQFRALEKIADWISVRGSDLVLEEVDEKWGEARATMEEGLDRLPVVFKFVEKEEL